MNRTTNTHPHAAAFAALLGLGACGLTVGVTTGVAARAAETTRPTPPPAPAGVIVGDPVQVTVVSKRQHGDPGGIPFARVSGAYRLTDFPYAAAERSASVLFSRSGCYPAHRVVTAPTGNAAPRLGKTALAALPQGRGCVAGIVSERDEDGIRRYVSGSFRITPVGGTAEEAVTVTTRGQGFFRRALEPGKYVVDDVHTRDAQSIEINPRSTTLVRFDRDPVVAAPANTKETQ